MSRELPHMFDQGAVQVVTSIVIDMVIPSRGELHGAPIVSSTTPRLLAVDGINTRLLMGRRCIHSPFGNQIMANSFTGSKNKRTQLK